VKIKVTKKNIEQGVRGSYTECPVALAFLDSGLFELPYVESSYVIEYSEAKPWTNRRFKLPSAVAKWIEEFDLRRRTGSEFEFEFDGTLEFDA